MSAQRPRGRSASALWTIIARATDATGEQSVQVKLGKCSVYPTEETLQKVRDGVADMYCDSFEPPEEPTHVGAAVLPYSEEQDA